MNPFVFYILIAFVIIVVLYMMIKKQKISSLNKAIGANDVQGILDMTQTKGAKYLLSAYIRDFYCAKAYQMKDIEALKAHLRRMFQHSYNVEDTGQYLVLYFHFFILRKDYDFAQEVLEVIKKTCNNKVVVYCVWTKEVLVDMRSDLVECMEQAIDKKEYYAFPLGVIAYLVGMQKSYLKQNEEAINWLQTALTVFQKKDIYVEAIQQEIATLQSLCEQEE